MNDYEVTFANGEVAVITAWTPEAALAIAEEEGDLYGLRRHLGRVRQPLGGAPGRGVERRMAGVPRNAWGFSGYARRGATTPHPFRYAPATPPLVRCRNAS